MTKRDIRRRIHEALTHVTMDGQGAAALREEILQAYDDHMAARASERGDMK